MIQYVRGVLFQSGCEGLVNTVNTKGVMGAGLARQFKSHFPRMLADYKRMCDLGQFKTGLVTCHRETWNSNPVWVINFPTKDDWRDPSRLEYIDTGLKDLKRAIRSTGIQSIAVPPLGTGLGGLGWPTVKALIEEHLVGLTDVRVMVYEPI